MSDVFWAELRVLCTDIWLCSKEGKINDVAVALALLIKISVPEFVVYFFSSAIDLCYNFW